MLRPTIPTMFVVALAFTPLAVHAQPATPSAPKAVNGIDSLHRVSATVTLAGNLDPSSMADLGRRGFTTVIGLRAPDEEGYDAAAVEAAARDAGLRWIALPFVPDAPDEATVDRVLAVLAAPDTTQAIIFCKTGQRAALMWFAKRVVRDGIGQEQAMSEATTLGLVRADLKAFALGYVAARAAGRPPQ